VSPVRLVAVDLDGTLIGPDLKISDVDRKAIERAAAAGVEICIATGRLFSAGVPFANALGVQGHLIPLNGAAVFDIASAEMVRAVPLDASVAREALEATRAAGMRPQLYFGDRLYLDGSDERSDEYLRLSRVVPVMVPDLAGLLVGTPPGPGPMKFLAIGDPSTVQTQVQILGARFGKRANVFRSLPQYLEVTDPRADKATALQWVAAQRKLERNAVAAIGDADNDAPMLKWAGRSFAVANGSALAKESAQRVVGAQGAGVAEAFADLFDGVAVERA
jgi:Cof subfamily protein (haloacid dehalogenase superfamily)